MKVLQAIGVGKGCTNSMWNGKWCTEERQGLTMTYFSISPQISSNFPPFPAIFLRELSHLQPPPPPTALLRVCLPNTCQASKSMFHLSQCFSPKHHSLLGPKNPKQRNVRTQGHISNGPCERTWSKGGWNGYITPSFSRVRTQGDIPCKS